MTSLELRKKFLEFFEEKGHVIIPGAPLIPERDPTVLFTTAGMHPLVPYLLGEKHPAGKRLVNVQKCVRTSDIDEVGGFWHVTFFEMLGNWSLGDPASPDGVGETGYWKKEAIEWSFQFLTNPQWLGIPIKKLAISCFFGDKEVPKDEESARVWESLGIPRERIYFFGKSDNWWGPAGKIGPCGPDTEMFYWTGKGEPTPLIEGKKNPDWVEIWNDVFMEYNETAEGKYELLKQKNVDTGMGLERIIAVLNGQINVYETELFEPIILEIKKVAKISELPADSFDELYRPGQIVAKEIAGLKKKAEKERAVRIIADHLKAATFILAEGLEPSNVERGYVLRRLIRRAVRYGKQLGINDIFTFKVAKVIIEIYKDIYPELSREKNFIEEQLVREEEKFIKTLEKGIREFEKIKKPEISGKELFDLYQTYGFPLEMTIELAKEKGMAVDEKGFQKEFEKHQELSHTASEGMFKSGLADHSEMATKYHTATHLLLAALRKVLGEHVFQKGSNITSERLRFDFSHSEKMTEKQIKKVEEIVNEKIKEDLPVKMEEMTLEEAKKKGATGVFESKYGEKVKVYTIFSFSREICGGPHIERTGVLGKFKILKEESSSAGVRRIKAVLE